MASVSVTSETRAFPASGPGEERTAPLSILDATVANFTPTEVVLAYDAPAPTPTAMLDALRRVLDAYPQWSGRLHRLPFDPVTRRYGRLALTWGRADDPGVAFVEARCDMSLADAAPDRDSHPDLAWDPCSFPAAQLVPHTPLAAPLAPDNETTARPALLAQLTTFSCGGQAVGLRLAHPLADAHTLAQFLRAWAAAARVIATSPPAPLFHPALLDARAAPAPPSVALATLPSNRFDWWLSNANSPFPPVHPPPELTDGGAPLATTPGTPMPWADWDTTAPVAHRVLRFRRTELLRLWQAVSVSTPADDDDAETPTISRLDALLGHLWARITHARGQAHSDETVTLDYTLGVRGRVEPPLPDAFVGSPLVLAAATAPARDVVVSSANAARLLRATVAACTPEAVGAHLREKGREECPQRFWQAFLGRRHLLVTSWVRTRLYEVDFGMGAPRVVQAAMPRLDGLVQVMEAPPPPLGEGGLGGHWVDGGVDVQVYLVEGVMEKLLRDPKLRRYRT